MTATTLTLLRDYESRNVTFIEDDGSWPIVWQRAQGVHVRDAEGRKYLDLTAAFGVASAGHANPRVVGAARRQMETLLHAMGDVHPHRLKAELARELSRMTFGRWARAKFKVPADRGKSIFCNSGFEAVEAALKTAMLATGRRGIVAFQGAYHGLGYGALNATHRPHFRGAFESQLGMFGRFVPFPGTTSELAATKRSLERELRTRSVGAVLVEPVQGRGGIRVPPIGFLAMLRRLCHAHGTLLVADEILTGFGRTGHWFAFERERVAPDMICLGKALTGGFPLSACVGRADLMDAAWPASTGEAIHTSTFLGHPVGCAMALATIAEIRGLKLVTRSRRLGAWLRAALSKVQNPKSKVICRARGIGLMAGLELTRPDGTPATAEALSIVKSMLRRGFILLPEGGHSNVVSFTPPLTITAAQLKAAVAALQSCLAES